MMTKRFNKFINPNNGKFYAYCVVPITFLSELAPDDCEHAFDVDGNRLTIVEFVSFSQLNLAGDKALIGLACKQADCGRLIGTIEHDLCDWEEFLTPLNLTPDLWLTIEGMQATLQGEEWYVGE